MSERFEMSLEELEAERGVELPEREAMGLININIAPVVSVNTAVAFNVLTNRSEAEAWAIGIVKIGQGNG